MLEEAGSAYLTHWEKTRIPPLFFLKTETTISRLYSCMYGLYTETMKGE